MSGNPVWPATRWKVWGRDRFYCVYCWDLCFFPKIGVKPGDPSLQREPTIDHVIPRVDGGSNRAENLVTACRRCNTLKGRRSAAWIRERIGMPV